MKQISPGELYHLLKQNPVVKLIDVREQYEHDVFNIGGTLIPLEEIMKQKDIIPNKEPVIVYCRKGIRSAIAIQRLEEKFGFTNLINLAGGMDAWQRSITKSKLP